MGALIMAVLLLAAPPKRTWHDPVIIVRGLGHEGIGPDEVPSVDVNDRVSAALEFGDARVTPEAGDSFSLTGPSFRARVQHVFGRNLVVRGRLAGGAVSSDGPAAAPRGGGFSWVGGATLRLVRTRQVEVALDADAEYGHGFHLGPVLAPRQFRDESTGAGALGASVLVQRGQMPIYAHARFIGAVGGERDPSGALDLGIGGVVDLRNRLPLSGRAHYRFLVGVAGEDHLAHELGFGLYYTVGRTRFGPELSASFTFLGEERARGVSLLLRFDHCWKANLGPVFR